MVNEFVVVLFGLCGRCVGLVKVDFGKVLLVFWSVSVVGIVAIGCHRIAGVRIM